MHRNYFLFKKQVSNLKEQLQSALIVNCFSYRKDELIIECQNQEHYFLRINVQAHLPYILLDRAHKIRDPRIQIFEKIGKSRLKDIKIIPFDKKVYIQTEEYTLLCVFYGANQNIYLVKPDGTIETSFKKDKKKESEHSPDEERKQFSASDFQALEKPESDQFIAEFFKQNVGGYNNLLIRELCFRNNLNSEAPLKDIHEKEWLEIKRDVLAFDREIDTDRCILYEHATGIPILSLLSLKHLDPVYVPSEYADLNKAWGRFVYLHHQKHKVQQKLLKCRALIEKRLDYLHKTLIKISDFSDLEEKKKLSEMKGYLLQTFSHEIRRGDRQVTLNNLYSEKGEEIFIKLDPGLSVQENAARYFSKYKNIDKMKTELISKKDTYRDELNYWKNVYEDSKKIDSLKKVEKLEEILTQKRIWQKGISNKKSVVLDKASFNRLLLDNKWEILIGKNSGNNDLLTFKFAHKYDYWLHAQGVPGSHVIIHQSDKNIDPPMSIIEKTASIAAYFSAAKTSSTVPVNYTKVKYVRKPRKAQPGTVIISHSKTLFVEPKKYL